MGNTFISDEFMLQNDAARKLYHGTAEGLPIIDFHNHLNVREIYEDKQYKNLTEVWLGGDHYKWRAMRWNGIPEELITGDGDDYDKFLAWADTVEQSFGNPLYHWTHLELRRYFGIEETLSPRTAKKIWEEANAKLQTPAYSVRNLLRMQQAEVLCTTDDPSDSLEWHQCLRESGFEIQVLPSFRPDKAIDIRKEGFLEYLDVLGECAGVKIMNTESLLRALENRLDFFIEQGCRVTDHSLETSFFQKSQMPAVEAEKVFRKRLSGIVPDLAEAAAYRGYILAELGKRYKRRGLVMQFHIGAMRNNSSRMFERLGVDTGFDSMNDFSFAPELAGLLDAMDRKDELPKTILYCLNAKDIPMLAGMAGNFQSNSEGIRGKVQLGAAWWFCDHLQGMKQQMDALMEVGLLSSFVGMLTDSRSFLSFPRHEYFRRILCNQVGRLVEEGQYPEDMDYLRRMIRGICHDNAKIYFSL